MQTDRRNAIVAIAASATALAVPTAAVAAPADRRAWEAALARVNAAWKAHEEYRAAVFQPLYDAERNLEAAYGVAHKLPDGSWSRTYFQDRKALHARIGTDHLCPEDVHNRIEALCDASTVAEGDAMRTPAPDLAALRWKLDRALELEHAEDEDGGSTAAWSARYVRQMLADIARLLPDAG